MVYYTVSCVRCSTTRVSRTRSRGGGLVARRGEYRCYPRRRRLGLCRGFPSTHTLASSRRDDPRRSEDGSLHPPHGDSHGGDLVLVPSVAQAAGALGFAVPVEQARATAKAPRPREFRRAQRQARERRARAHRGMCRLETRARERRTPETRARPSERANVAESDHDESQSLFERAPGWLASSSVRAACKKKNWRPPISRRDDESRRERVDDARGCTRTRTTIAALFRSSSPLSSRLPPPREFSPSDPPQTRPARLSRW